MAVGLPWFILLYTLIVGAQATLIPVKGYDAFMEQSTGVAKVVLLITCDDCDNSPEVEEQVAGKCQENPDIKCFIDDLGKFDGVWDKSYKSTPYFPDYVPYVAFIFNGKLIATLDVKDSSKNHEKVEAGFARLAAAK